VADKLVTLARYYDIVEAQLVKNHLESEGIPVFISGDTTVGMLGGMGGGLVELLVAEEHLRWAHYLLYKLHARDEDEDTGEVDELDSGAITCEKPLSRPTDELPGDGKAIQATPPVKHVVEPTAETRLTTTPNREALRNDTDRTLPDLRLEKNPREFTWLIVLEVLFWAVVLLSAIAQGCFK
jgi:hypothetical protein